MNLSDLDNIPALPPQYGPARQVAYIVKDIHAGMEAWRKNAVTPFLVTHNVSPLQNARYRGTKSGKTPVHIAFAYAGDMQIELIEPLHTTPSIYSEAIERNIASVHHYAVCVDDFAASYNHALDNGYEAIVDSGVDGLARMSYVENRHSGVILEIIEWNSLTRPYFDGLRTMWDKAAQQGEDVEFNLQDLTPTGAILKGLARFIGKKLTGQIQTTRRTA